MSSYEDKSHANANVAFYMMKHFAELAPDELIDFAERYPLMLSDGIVGEERALNIESAADLLLECSDFIKDDSVAKAVAREGSNLQAMSNQIRIALKDSPKY